MLGSIILASVALFSPATSGRAHDEHHRPPPPKHHHWRYATASVYDDSSGRTACGFVARYGVAHKSKPCGYHVRFRYHGHEVTATVDDRGPYVSGRTWDLDYATMHRLRFPYGVDTVAYRHVH